MSIKKGSCKFYPTVLWVLYPPMLQELKFFVTRMSQLLLLPDTPHPSTSPTVSVWTDIYFTLTQVKGCPITVGGYVSIICFSIL